MRLPSLQLLPSARRGGTCSTAHLLAVTCVQQDIRLSCSMGASRYGSLKAITANSKLVQDRGMGASSCCSSVCVAYCMVA